MTVGDLTSLRFRVASLIGRLSNGAADTAARDGLLAEVLAYQAARVPPYGRLVAAAEGEGFPALPTDVFRYVRVASYPEAEDRKVFRTSGTTSGVRGAHAFRDLTLYDQAARAAGGFALFPEGEPMRLVVLAPSVEEAPDSSLSYMLERFMTWFGNEHSEVVWSCGELQVQRLRTVLDQACASGRPLALLGTSFAFAYAEEALGEQRFVLPSGSRIMQTGGFKGRTKEIEPEAMAQMLFARYGVPHGCQAQEYGMTELSSQMYTHGLREALLRERVDCASCSANDISSARVGERERELWVPGWVRVRAVDPTTLEVLPDGEPGLLRIDDLANLDSVSAIQTADLAEVRGQRVRLLGRAPGALPRGCSLAIEEALR